MLALLIAFLLAMTILSDKYGKFLGIENRLVIIVDNSPSMATQTSDGSSRFVKAIELARKLVKELDSGARVMIRDTQGFVSAPRFDISSDALKLIDSLVLGKDISLGVTDFPWSDDFIGSKYYFISVG